MIVSRKPATSVEEVDELLCSRREHIKHHVQINILTVLGMVAAISTSIVPKGGLPD